MINDLVDITRDFRCLLRLTKAAMTEITFLWRYIHFFFAKYSALSALINIVHCQH